MRALLAALLACGLLVAAPAAAEEPRQTARELLDDAADKLLQALRLMLSAVPQYAMPEVTEDGDIVIRRIRPVPPEAPAPLPPDEPAQTRT